MLVSFLKCSCGTYLLLIELSYRLHDFKTCSEHIYSVKHRHAKRARVIFFVIGAFVKLFAEMIWLNVQYDLHTMLHR